MKSWHVLIASIVAIGVTANLLAMGTITAMMNASIIGLGVFGLYHLVKKMRKNAHKSVDSPSKTFTLVPKKNTGI